MYVWGGIGRVPRATEQLCKFANTDRETPIGHTVATHRPHRLTFPTHELSDLHVIYMSALLSGPFLEYKLYNIWSGKHGIDLATNTGSDAILLESRARSGPRVMHLRWLRVPPRIHCKLIPPGIPSHRSPLSFPSISHLMFRFTLFSSSGIHRPPPCFELHAPAPVAPELLAQPNSLPITFESCSSNSKFRGNPTQNYIQISYPLPSSNFIWISVPLSISTWHAYIV